MHYHVTTAENLDGIMREGLVPRVGPRAAAIGEPVAGVFLFPDAEALEGGLGGWLGEQFDEDEALVLLGVEVPPGTPVAEGAGFETVVTATLPPSCLAVLHRDLGSVCSIEEALAGGGAPAPGA